MGGNVVEVVEGEVDHTTALVVAELVRLGLAVRVICPRAAVGIFDGTGAAVTPLAVGTGVASLSALRRLLRGDGEAPRIDLVHAHGLRAGLAVTLARPAGTPLLLTFTDPLPTAGAVGLVARTLARTVVPAATAVLAATPDLAQEATQLGAREVALIAPTMPEPPVAGRDAEQVREELALPPEGPIVLAQGRLLAQTRFDVLIDASIRWRQPGGPHVVLAGVGPAYRELVARATIGRAPVTFAGDRDAAGVQAGEERASVEDLLAAASVAVVTDVRARPEFALRAARAGVALVVPRGAVLAGLFGQAAVTVPAGDVDALDEAVRSLLTDAAARAGVARALRELAASWPDARYAAAELAQRYDDVSRATVERPDERVGDTPDGTR